MRELGLFLPLPMGTLFLVFFLVSGFACEGPDPDPQAQGSPAQDLSPGSPPVGAGSEIPALPEDHAPSPPQSSAVRDDAITGELKKWHKITLTFEGPASSETGEPNPFRDFRLSVAFTQGSTRYEVPGYFAADGDAADTDATAGSKWRAHFIPDQEGEWTYEVSFRQGTAVAVSLDPVAGEPAGSPDGRQGRFFIGPTDKSGLDLRGKGMARLADEHLLRFAETGEYLLKGGPGDPENFLAYVDFAGGGRHKYEKHVADWRPGDPTWSTDKGKGIIGAINYLSSVGMNTHYLITMNVNGDGDDVWPWIERSDQSHFDVSKLAQWGVVFDHFTARGMNIHLIHQEQETDQNLNGGSLGIERKMYYRELVARFSHALSLVWNLGEENTNTDSQRKEFASYLRSVDPYDHPIVVHTYPSQVESVYRPLLGYADFNGVALQQSGTGTVHAQLLRWYKDSEGVGHPWLLASDECTGDGTLKPGAENASQRAQILYGSLMAGGWGAELYMGMSSLQGDGDYRQYARVWEWTRHALAFFRTHLPYWEMAPSDGLVSSGWCLAKPGEHYAIYLAKGGTVSLDLSGATGTFAVRWYDPRNGGDLLEGTVVEVRGGGRVALGNPPTSPTTDWVILVKRS